MQKKAFANGMPAGALTLPDTKFRPPFCDLLMLLLLRPIFPNLPCPFSNFHLEYPSVLYRFCLQRIHAQKNVTEYCSDFRMTSREDIIEMGKFLLHIL